MQLLKVKKSSINFTLNLRDHTKQMNKVAQVVILANLIFATLHSSILVSFDANYLDLSLSNYHKHLINTLS
jgi:hypothetical protein